MARRSAIPWWWLWTLFLRIGIDYVDTWNRAFNSIASDPRAWMAHVEPAE